MKMRCVCLREPWLYLMLDIEDPELRKNVENRSRCITRQMGPILVKSSAPKPRGTNTYQYEDADLPYYKTVRDVVLGRGWLPASAFPEFEQLQFGGIRGALNFSKLLAPGSSVDSQYRWKFPEYFGYVVDKSLKLPFREMKGGAQGIFYPEITDAEAAALRAAGLLKEAA